MGVMKTLAIAMEDEVLDNPDLEDVRREGWSDSLAGIYRPEQFAGGELRDAYRLGRSQFEEAAHEAGVR